MRAFIQMLIEGIEQGSVYALWAIGYGLVYQVLGLMNFAFGDTLLLGLYLMVGLSGVAGFPMWGAIAIMFVVVIASSMVIERQVYARFVGKRQAEAGFIAALACAYIIRNIATAIFGNDPLSFPQIFPSSMVTILGFKVDSGGLTVLGVCVLVLLFFLFFLRRTKIGRATMLVGQDRSAAAVVGIPVRRIVTVVYGVSGLIGAVGAVMFADLFRGVNSGLGFYITIQAFIAATVGGTGSVLGGVLAGLTLGVLEAASVTYVSGTFSEAIAWVVLGVIVLARPQGMLGRVAVERV